MCQLVSDPDLVCYFVSPTSMLSIFDQLSPCAMLIVMYVYPVLVCSPLCFVLYNYLR